MKSRIVTVAVVLVVAFFALTVWPTAYRYFDNAMYINGNSYPVREHRITGRLSYLSVPMGWVEVEAPPPVDEARR